MQFNREKLKTVILYACTKCDASALGAVKLHKLLYFSDMLHYVQMGAPITGATYRKRPLGPTCDNLLPILRDLAQAKLIKIDEVDYFGYRKKEFIALEQPEMERLSNTEIELLDEVIEFVCLGNSARTISEYSHNKAWEIAGFGDVLPYHSAYHLFPSEVSLETLNWAESEAKKIEVQGRESGVLETTSFENFRDRVLEASG